ncbi:hypothetical protein GCM10011379_05680 [Filimonas zeae]|uniref:Phage tail collar domain-containing protein n=2 Tax=Filimonas zeae TaxID=1737353 RepID=A0A917IPW6_9BACT|nr:hypothetical protein GCM10011379_05680 [Filimonas zeae]
MQMKYAISFFSVVGLYCVITFSSYAQNNALKIQPNGNVGIGTETPTEKLEVEGNLKVNGRIMDKAGLVMPAGTILPYAGSVAPAGWLLCNGASYAKNGDQKDLYTIIGTMYGSDGDKFRVPDLRGSFVMGAVSGDANDSLGKRGSADVHTHSVIIPPKTFSTTSAGNHSHKFPAKWYFRSLKDAGWLDEKRNGIDTYDRIENQTTQEAGAHTHEVTVELPAGTTNNSSGKNRPQWIALNYIIKY